MARRRSPSRRYRIGLVFITPFFALFAATMIAPMAYAAWLSMYHEESSGLGFGGTENVFVGLANYTRALDDSQFWHGFATIAIYCAVAVPVTVGGGLALALLLDSAYARAKKFFQLALYAPHIVPGLIAGLIWMYLYTPGLSPIVEWFERTGPGWNLNSTGAAVLSIVNVTFWGGIGYNMVILFASLQAIPRDYLEAATMDGAGPLRVALRIKVPLIKDSIAMIALFGIIGALQIFTEPFLIKDQSKSIDSAWTPVMYIYNVAFARNDYGLAAASSLVFAVLLAAGSFVITKVTSRKALV